MNNVNLVTMMQNTIDDINRYKSLSEERLEKIKEVEKDNAELRKALNDKYISESADLILGEHVVIHKHLLEELKERAEDALSYADDCDDAMADVEYIADEIKDKVSYNTAGDCKDSITTLIDDIDDIMSECNVEDEENENA